MFAYTKEVERESGLYLYELKAGREQLLIQGPGEQPVLAAPPAA